MNELYKAAPRLQGVESSPTVRLNALAQDLIRQGQDVINLTAGETDFATAPDVIAAAKNALDQGHIRYTNPHGIPELRQAASDWFKREYTLDYKPTQITTTCGVKQGLFNLLLATVGPGDEVLIPAPYWVSYPEMVRIAGGKPITVPYEKGFQLDISALKKLITPKTRLLLLNSPGNPSGVVYPRETLVAIAKMLEGTNVLVAADEIYSFLVYDGVNAASFASISNDAYSRTITFNGLSKSHAMTGWRVGFAAGPAEIIEKLGILQGQSATNIVSFVQWAAIEALQATRQQFEVKRADLEKRRNFMLEALRPLSGLQLEPPMGAFYLFPDASAYFKGKVQNSMDLAEYLLTEGKVVVVPGKPFGADPCIRLSFSKDMKTLATGCARIVAALQKL